MQSEKRLWGEKPFHSLDYQWKEQYGGKVYRLSLQTGCTCPNRDGTLGERGCIFCSAGGSGDFAAPARLPVQEQIHRAKALVEGKLPKQGLAGYIGYFQSFTNTYGPVPRLREIFSEAMAEEDILGISIGTRPDCLPEEMVEMLGELNRRKPVTVELGLQTIHEKSAEFIRRGYGLPLFEDAVKRLKQAGLEVVVHVILGLPGETEEMMKETVSWIGDFRTPRGGIDGIKLQLLHILKGTDLGELYLEDHGENAGKDRISSGTSCGISRGICWNDYSLEEYVDLVIDLLEILPPEMTVHRITGDAPRKLLIAPLWSGDKKRVLNTFTRRFSERDTWQGKLYHSSIIGGKVYENRTGKMGPGAQGRALQNV